MEYTKIHNYVKNIASAICLAYCHDVQCTKSLFTSNSTHAYYNNCNDSMQQAKMYNAAMDR